VAKNNFFYPINTGFFSYEPGYRLKRSSYDSFLFMFIKKGSCKGETGGKKFTAHEGQIVFLNCYISQTYYSDVGWDAEWLHFDGILAKQYFELLNGEENPVITLKDTYRFEKYLRRIYLVFRQNEPIKEAVLNNWIVNLLTELLSTRDQQDSSSQPVEMTEDIIAYIREHLTENLSLDFLAEKANLSPFYFTRLFKKETGFTPHEYVIASRVNNAKYFLKRTAYTIKEICYMTGFSSESSFCTTFRKKVGVTPNDYREKEI